jgi:hypothetical protein
MDMDPAGIRQEGSGAYRPVLTELFAEIAERTAVGSDGPELLALRQAVDANEDLLSLLDHGSRLPFDDPYDFVRVLHGSGDANGTR